MMIKRHNMFRFERLVSKLFPADNIPRMITIADEGNECRMIAAGKENALVMTVPGSNGTVSINLSWPTLKEIVTRKVGLVEFNVSKNSATVSWENNGVPQQKPVDIANGEPDSLPALPAQMEAIDPGLLDALVSGSRTVDPDNTKYPLGGLCLRGKTSQVVSTDGRQAFMQDGYAFPWEDDVLCPVSKIYASKELRESAESVRIGFEKEWIAFEVDNVTFWKKSIKGGFPKLDQFCRNIGHFTWLHLDPVEAAFVADRLVHLPGAKDKDFPVYLELGDAITVRGHDTVLKTAVEIRMPKSRYEGNSVKLPINRQFLKNAIELGSTRIGIDPKASDPLVCYGEGTMFIIMPLTGKEPKAKSVTMLKTDKSMAPPAVMSPVEPEEDEEPVVHSEPKSKASRPKRTANVSISGKTSPEIVDDHSKSISRSEAIAEAEQLYDILKDATGRARNLVRQLKGSRKHERDLLLREQRVNKSTEQLKNAFSLVGKL